jgi:hypothetical protein
MKFVESLEVKVEEVIDKRRFALIERLFLKAKHIARTKGAKRELSIHYRGERDGFLRFDLTEENSIVLVTDDLGFLRAPLNEDGVPMVDEDGKPLPFCSGKGQGRVRPISEDVDPKEWYGDAYLPLQHYLGMQAAVSSDEMIAAARLKNVEVHFKDGSSKVMPVDEVAEYRRQKKLIRI